MKGIEEKRVSGLLEKLNAKPKIVQITPDLVYLPDKSGTDYLDGPFLILNGTDFSYAIADEPNGEVYRDSLSNVVRSRLIRVHQLGIVGTSSNNACQDQTRDFHSLVAAVMMDLVLTRNGFGTRQRRRGIFAANYHDAAMLPFSDTGKLLKPGDYEEETLIEYVLNKSSEIKEILSKYGLNVKSLVATIRGNSPVGQLLNSKEGLDVDNISYLAIDQTRVSSNNFFSASQRETKDRRERRQLQRVPGIFDQYNNIKYVDGKWVFDNPLLLAKLLKFRALMYKTVYHNPMHRSKEAFMTRALKGQELSLSEALKWGDEDFEKWFRTKFGEKLFKDFFWICRDPFREIGREYDLTKIDELRKEREKGNIRELGSVVVEHLNPPRNALTNFVLFKGKVKLLEEITDDEVPGITQLVDETRRIITRLNYIGVYQRVEVSQ